MCLLNSTFVFFDIRVNYFLSLESTPEKISFEVTKRRMTSQKCSLFVISGLGKYELKRKTESSPSHDERLFYENHLLLSALIFLLTGCFNEKIEFCFTLNEI